MGKLSAKIVFKVVKYAITIGLIVISLLLSWRAFVKFESKDTNLKKRQVEVTKYPTITLCLKPIRDDFHFNIYESPQEFGSDLKHTLNKLQEGENAKLNVKVTKITSYANGRCYKMSPIRNSIELSDIMVLSVKFNKLIQDFASQSVEIFVTSESNAFGIFRVGSSENSMSCSLTCMLTNMENFMLFNMHVTQHAIWFI